MPISLATLLAALRDRFFWVGLCRFWRNWRSTLVIVKPETIVAWHRKGFRLFWTWKVRRGQPGRPIIPPETRDLIRKICRENPGWGAPRIHGELLKLVHAEVPNLMMGKFPIHVYPRIFRPPGGGAARSCYTCHQQPARVTPDWI